MQEKLHRTKVATRDELIKAYESQYKDKNIPILCFYSSDIDMIVDDPAFMLMPIDDRIINRAHGVFDTMSAKQFRINRLQQHLERFQSSAKKVGIELPMSIDNIKKIMIDMAYFAYKRLVEQDKDINKISNIALNIKIWLSSGKGDFWIYSLNKKSIFYAAVSIPNTPIEKLQQGVKEYSICLEEKNDDTGKAKSVNYIENSLMANYSKERGGYLGLKSTPENYVIEASIANSVVILKNKEFITTPWEQIIAGTTLKKILQYINQELIPKGLISKVVFRNITLDEIYSQASEMILLGGDKIVPVLELNDKLISDGKKGQICQLLQEWYKTQESAEGDEILNIDEIISK